MPLKILVADDSPVDAMVVRNVLQRAGYEPVLVSGGAAGLEHLSAGGGIDLVIADVQMPEMGGIEFVEKIRAAPGLADLPVIFVSAAADADTVRIAVRLHSSGYVLKPIREPSRLLQLVREAIGEPEATGTVSADSGASAGVG